VLLDRMLTLNLEILAKVEDSISDDATGEEACGICHDVYGNGCVSPSGCRTCGFQAHFGKGCLIG
jgi:hypothetical protein